MTSLFCTYFDHNYLPRGMVLYDSLKRHCPDAILHVLALSEDCERILAQWSLPDVVVTPLHTLEAHDPQLAASKTTRSLMEYYFTLSPCWPLYLLKVYPDINMMTYVDADCALWGDPAPVLAEMDKLSVGIVGHRFPERLRHLEIWGTYNVGWLSFKRDSAALACLGWWRERCLEWCEDRLDGDRFADQKYLDQWPSLFPGVEELASPAVNVAPWNVERISVSVDDGSFTAQGHPLVCYHFHGCKHLFGPVWDTGLAEYGVELQPALRAMYRAYIQNLQRWEHRLTSEFATSTQSQRHRAHGSALRQMMRRARTLAYLAFRRTLLWNI